MWKPKDTGSGKGNISSQPVTNNTYDWLVGRFVKSVNLKRYSGSGIAWGGNRAVFAGVMVNSINYVTIMTLGNASSFGALTVISGRSCFSSCSNGSRGIFAGGNLNVIDFITIAVASNAVDFGDMLLATNTGCAACSNGVRGLFAGAGSDPNVISYITISMLGNSLDFGDLSIARTAIAAFQSSVKGFFAGGYINSSTNSNVIDSVVFTTLGNASDFGDLIQSKNGLVGGSNDTRAIIGKGTITAYGDGASNTINYVTISTNGNASNFGDATIGGRYPAASNNSSRLIFIAGEIAASSYTNVIDYVTISVLSNAIDFGDINGQYNGLAGCSGN